MEYETLYHIRCVSGGCNRVLGTGNIIEPYEKMLEEGFTKGEALDALGMKGRDRMCCRKTMMGPTRIPLLKQDDFEVYGKDHKSNYVYEDPPKLLNIADEEEYSDSDVEMSEGEEEEIVFKVNEQGQRIKKLVGVDHQSNNIYSYVIVKKSYDCK